MLDTPAPSLSWVDLHAHILPYFDDGAQTLYQAVEMMRLAQADGIGCMAATPHSGERPAQGLRRRVEAACAELNQALADAGLQTHVVPGVEAYMQPDLPRQAAEETIFPLGRGRHILVELPAGAFPLYTEQVIFELQVAGWGVILAHPERNGPLQEDATPLARLVERGVLTQVTTASLEGAFGAGVREVAGRLLRNGLVHLLASDAHSEGQRRPALAAAVRLAGEMVGMERAQAMAASLPAAILSGERLPDLPASCPPAKPAHWWRRLGRQR